MEKKTVSLRFPSKTSSTPACLGIQLKDRVRVQRSRDSELKQARMQNKSILTRVHTCMRAYMHPCVQHPSIIRPSSVRRSVRLSVRSSAHPSIHFRSSIHPSLTYILQIGLSMSRCAFMRMQTGHRSMASLGVPLTTRRFMGS